MVLFPIASLINLDETGCNSKNKIYILESQSSLSEDDKTVIKGLWRNKNSDQFKAVKETEYESDLVSPDWQDMRKTLKQFGWTKSRNLANRSLVTQFEVSKA